VIGSYAIQNYLIWKKIMKEAINVAIRVISGLFCSWMSFIGTHYVFGKNEPNLGTLLGCLVALYVLYQTLLKN